MSFIERFLFYAPRTTIETVASPDFGEYKRIWQQARKKMRMQLKASHFNSHELLFRLIISLSVSLSV